MKPAFSTVACPEKTLDKVAQAARRMNFEGVELRTFGFGQTPLACDPAQTSPEKLAALFDRQGVTPLSLATSLTFDQPVRPPVIGLAFMDDEAPIRRCRRLIELAAAANIPFVRVFAFQLHGNESRRSGLKRISARLRLAVDACRNTGVRLLLENGGSFCTSAEMLELIGMADMSDLLVAAYSSPVGRSAGESLEQAAQRLGDKLQVVKLKDLSAGRPARFGEGEGRVRADLAVLASRNYQGWVVVEHDRLWMPDAVDAEEALAPAPAIIVGAESAPPVLSPVR